jgi:hypothetical protein
MVSACTRANRVRCANVTDAAGVRVLRQLRPAPWSFAAAQAQVSLRSSRWFIAVHNVDAAPAKKWSAAVTGSHSVNRSAGEFPAVVAHPATFVTASAYENPRLDPPRKQLPARYSTKLRLAAAVFCTVMSVR